ncbi:MAG TPA: hypothetical protein VIZ64_10730 [Dokdonella sp.]
MKVRHVFRTASPAEAMQAVAAARSAGAEDDAITLVARSDIEMDEVPGERIEVGADIAPAAWRGAATGGALGVVGGVVGMAIPVIGLPLAGVGLVALTAAAVGAWSSALMGSTVPSEVRREFEAEIEAGRVLVVVDAPAEHGAAIEAAMRGVGAVPLPFEQLSALS